MNSTDGAERRESFRVSTEAIVQIHSDPPSGMANLSSLFPELHATALYSEMQALDSEIHTLMDRVKDLTVQKVLNLLHQRITQVNKVIDIQSIQNNNLASQTIDISEGGFSAMLQESLTVGDTVAVALVFVPNYQAIYCHAKVIDVSKIKSHLSFTGMAESQRQQLIRHMFKEQTSKNTLN